MTERRSDKFLEPYRDAVARHGPSFEATLWGSRDAQVLRFDVMIDLAGFEGCTVLDAGCGRGDFARRLLEREVEFASFIGLDAMKAMIDSARALDLPRCRFEVADFVSEPAVLETGAPDYICISGALNTMDDESARGVVQAAFDAAAQGVVFNFLSNRPHPRWAGRDLTPARRFDTLAWIDWSLARTSRIAFRQDYLDGHDATIMLRHDEG
ncbi:MAG: class I SAM-dependent methyltransferase [Planctomycetota bacterium]|jgi:SAM-dependent methyltransferase